MKLETWAAIAAIGLSAMFAVLIISLYQFLIGPSGKGPDTVADPEALVIQEASISGMPAVVISVFVFIMGRGYGAAQAGLLLVAAGAVMIAGMVVALQLLPKIPDQYNVGAVSVLPYVFIPIGIGISLLGAFLSVLSTKRQARNLDDLR